MKEISKYLFLSELIKINNQSPFIIELNEFNQLLNDLRDDEIYCKFDYLDIETYARTLPNIAQINKTSIRFYPTSEWINYINILVRESEKFSESLHKYL